MAAPSGPAAQTAATAVERAKALYVFSNEKGGMKGIDTEAINRIILETSGNSSYAAKQLKQDAKARPPSDHLPLFRLRTSVLFFAPPQVDESVLQMRRKLAALDAGARRVSRDEAQRRTDALERSRRMDRVCMVIDFDMFYAAVELRDRPELRELPVAVGGPGMITTANYVARRWGVRSAMPGFVGQALCRRGAEFGQPKAELIFL